MDKRRAEIQRQMTVNQIAEVNTVITQLRDSLKVAEICKTGIAVVSAGTVARAARNLEDLERRFLVGLIQEG